MNNVKLEITKLHPDSAEYVAAAAWAAENGSRKLTAREMQDGAPTARSVRYWVDNWGGYTGHLTLPDGSKHRVSLEPFKSENPDATFVRIRFTSAWEPSKRGAKG